MLGRHPAYNSHLHSLADTMLRVHGSILVAGLRNYFKTGVAFCKTDLWARWCN